MFKSAAAHTRFLVQYENTLRNWPVLFEKLFVPTRFGRTHLIASGDPGAPPLFLLPALYQCAPAWRANVGQLSRTFRTYAVDVLGEPNKSEQTSTMKTRHDQAGWFEDLLDGLSIRRASIVGNSYGGLIALNMASLIPARISKVVAISPSGPKSLVRLSWRFYFHIGAGVIPGVAPFRVWARNGVPIDPLDVPWQELVTTAMEQGRIRLPPSGEFGRAELKRIASPVLLLIGDHEVVYGPNPAKAMDRALSRTAPAFQGEIVPGGNHMAAMAQPDWVNERVGRFLAQ
jgi:pimeloyl-ACP methyl ester carboxylesterase